MNNFVMKTHMKALIASLEADKIVSSDKLKDIHDNKIIPEEMQNLKDTYSLIKKEHFEEGGKNGGE